jgi:hypothetical protein
MTPSLRVALVTGVLLALGVAALAATQPPAGFGWLDDWKLITAAPHVPQYLKWTTFTMRANDVSSFDLAFSNGGKGSLYTDSASARVMFFDLSETLPVEVRITPPTPTESQAIAAAFLHALFPLPADAHETVTPADNSHPGADFTEWSFVAVYRDVTIVRADVSVNVLGHVVGCNRTGDNLSIAAWKEMVASIPPSPGAATVRAAVRAYLDANGDTDAAINWLYRTSPSTPDGTDYYWIATVTKAGVDDWGVPHPEFYAMYVGYTEATQTLTTARPWGPSQFPDTTERRKPPVATPPQPEPPYQWLPTALTWSADGKQLWSSASLFWPQCHRWEYDSPATFNYKGLPNFAPNSLLVADLPAGNWSAYRPLVDIQQAWEYSNPVPSPDGRWLAANFEGRLIFLDLRFNRLYLVGTKGKPQMGLSAAWSSDATRFVTTTDEGLLEMTVASACGVPFADAPLRIPVSEGVASVAYLPGKANELIAVVTHPLSPAERKVMEPADNATEVIRIARPADTRVPAIVCVTFDTTAYNRSIQVLPDGGHAVLGGAEGPGVLDLATGKVTLLDGLTKGVTLAGKTFQLSPWGAWAISPDGKRIAYLAETAEELAHDRAQTGLLAAFARIRSITDGSDAVIVANLDGSDARLIATGPVDEEVPRYYLNGKDATVPLDAVPIALLQSQYRTTLPIWPTLAPPDGPWERP